LLSVDEARLYLQAETVKMQVSGLYETFQRNAKEKAGAQVDIVTSFIVIVF
jgi:hypothetical protein